MALKSLTFSGEYPRAHAAVVFLKELALLTKPNVLVMNALMTLGGLAMASRMDVSLGLKTMVGTVLAIAAAGTLNMYLERDADGLMKRTADRPLPAHRIGASVALISGLAMSTLSILELYFLVNPLTCLLAIAALLIYVCVYTPMKYKSPVALHVGSIAGAIPPLMGWTAARNEIQVGGLVLFAILYFWQLPHVTAISIYRDDDYRRAGIKTLPVVVGKKRAALHGFVYTVLLFFVAMLPVVTGMAGLLYGVVSSIAFIYFFWSAAICLHDPFTENPRRMFLASLLYLPVIIVALALSRFLE